MREENSDDFIVGNITISLQHNRITIDNKTCQLQPKVMALLHYLAKNNDRVINNNELLDQVWQGRVVTHGSVQKCVNALRAAFTELDASVEYVVYFSKRGYQLVTPIASTILNVENIAVHSRFYWRKPFLFIVVLVFVFLGAYQFYFYKSDVKPYITADIKALTDSVDVTQFTTFTQVKPYVSNTGREQIIEPHASSERVAFVRNEFVENEQVESEQVEDELVRSEQESQLFIQAANGQEWQLSVARGKFIALAWSHSGRNLVAIDVHRDNSKSSATERVEAQAQNTQNYYTFHIYTLDFKGEKVIEKNTLSHWNGNVSSVSWWGEDILEFTAYQGEQHERARYRYGIADQNLSLINASTSQGTLLSSHIFNKKTATLSLVDSGEKIQFLDDHQILLGQRILPFKVKSLSWISDDIGVFLLSDDNQLSLLYTDGSIRKIDYSPKVNGRIKQVRSKNKGKNIVLTVEDPLLGSHPLSYGINNNHNIEDSSNTKNKNVLSQERFMEKGGGFIYSKAN